MLRWIAVLAATALAVSVAYGQSSPQTQPTLPLGQGPSMGGHMSSPMMNGSAGMEHGMMSMMQRMHMMDSAMMGLGMQNADMMGQAGPMCRGQMAMMSAMGMQ